MKHILVSPIRPSVRIDVRRDENLLVASFQWKADDVLVESAEYAYAELERVLSEMRPGEPHYREFTNVLQELRGVLSTSTR